MIGLGIGIPFIKASGGAAYDADAQAFFDRVAAAGGTLSATEKTATNQLVLDMKSANIWTSMKAIYPMVGASAAACAQNLKSSSFTGSFTSGWTFASTGATPNGVSAYMSTGFVPSANLSVNSVHASLYLNTNNFPIASDPVDLGALVSTVQSLLIVQSSTASLAVKTRNVGLNIETTQTTRVGFTTSSKTSATLTTLYKNGVDIVNGNSGGNLPNIQTYLGGLNLTNALYGATNNRIALHSLGDGLTNTQASNFYTAVQAFQTTLSRQV